MYFHDARWRWRSLIQTKLAAAASIVAASGKTVTIVRCGTPSAAQALRMERANVATVLVPRATKDKTRVRVL